MKIRKFNSEEKYLESAIIYIKQIVDNSEDVCRIALSGGSTPKSLYEALSKSDIGFSKVEFYQVDERYVTQEDENSNYKLINQSLVKPIGDKLKRFYYFDTSLPIDECVKKYSEAIQNANFDLIILGIGPDGHTASLFPGDKETIDSVEPALHTTTEMFAVKDRLTISLKKIQESKNKLLLVKGLNKQPILDDLLNSEKSIYEMPAKGVLVDSNLDSDTMIYTLFIA